MRRHSHFVALFQITIDRYLNTKVMLVNLAEERLLIAHQRSQDRDPDDGRGLPCGMTWTKPAP